MTRLSALGEPGAQALAFWILDTAEPTLQADLAEVMGEHGGVELAGPLAELLASSNDVALKQEVAVALGKIGTADALEALDREARAATDAGYLAVLRRALTQCYRKNPVGQYLAALAAGKTRRAITRAADALCLIAGEAQVEALLANLSNPDVWTRHESARVLGEISGPEASQALGEQYRKVKIELEQSSPERRDRAEIVDLARQTLLAIAAIGERSGGTYQGAALGLARDGLASPDIGVRCAAATALGRLRLTEAWTVLREARGDSSEVVRAEVARAAASHAGAAPAEVVSALSSLAQDPSRACREEAARALASLGPSPALTELIATAEVQNLVVIVEALAKRKEEATVDYLVELIAGDRHTLVVHAAIRALGAVGLPAALGPLARRAEVTQNQAELDEAAHAIAAHRTAEAVGILTELAAKSVDRTRRLLSLVGSLVQIAEARELAARGMAMGAAFSAPVRLVQSLLLHDHKPLRVVAARFLVAVAQQVPDLRDGIDEALEAALRTVSSKSKEEDRSEAPVFQQSLEAIRPVLQPCVSSETPVERAIRIALLTHGRTFVGQLLRAFPSPDFEVSDYSGMSSLDAVAALPSPPELLFVGEVLPDLDGPQALRRWDALRRARGWPVVPTVVVTEENRIAHLHDARGVVRVVAPPALPEELVIAAFAAFRRRVLIADDSRMARRQLQEMAEASGLAVVGTASDGREALALFLRSRPDLLLLDLVMPNVSGMEVLAALRKLGETAPIVMVSSFPSGASAETARRLGADAFLKKPVRALEMEDVILPALYRLDNTSTARAFVLPGHEVPARLYCGGAHRFDGALRHLALAEAGMSVPPDAEPVVAQGCFCKFSVGEGAEALSTDGVISAKRPGEVVIRFAELDNRRREAMMRLMLGLFARELRKRAS
ncbi:MAG: HEAT repeat domain-containing protein [Candidatus Schekmanbacteria bacterium]|nr:HEAT repeat domain-containing protein [Candidatus Schekmanbacteria bacterium]